jgi:hypothetical protein
MTSLVDLGTIIRVLPPCVVVYTLSVPNPHSHVLTLNNTLLEGAHATCTSHTPQQIALLAYQAWI